MNTVDIILAVLILLTTFVGYKKGIVLSLLSLVRFLIGLPLSYYISNAYYTFVYDNFVHKLLLESITKKINNSTDINTYISNIQSSIDSISPFVKGDFDLSSIKSLSADSAAAYITDNIAQPIAYILIKIVLFVAVLLIFYLFCAIIGFVIKKLRNKNKRSLVKTTSSILGGIFGIIKGCLLVLTVASIAYLIIDITGSDKNEFIKMLDSSAIIEFINEYNPLINLI